MSRPDSINDENEQGDGGNATIGDDLDALAQLVAQGRPTPLGTKAK